MRRFIGAALMAIAVSSTLFGQEPVPRDLYEGGLRRGGNSVVFCLWPDSPLYAFDRALGAVLADALLLEPGFHDATGGPGVQQTFEGELFINLQDHCDLAMGTSLAWSPIPTWLTISRSYYDAPFVAVATTDTYASLSDVPPGGRIGSVVFTPGDTELVTYNQTLSDRDRWRRLPYSSYGQLYAALAAGEVDVGLFWLPALAELRGAAAGEDLVAVELLPVDLVPLDIAPQQLGISMLAANTFLRTLVDDAIGRFQADGTLSALLEQHGLQ